MVAFDTLPGLLAHGYDEVLDVRSPSEFAEDHLPGAVSLPVLSDAERAVVGTIYKQESAFRARKVGAALVARNAARHIESHLADRDGGYRPLVYCWRGGQRSNSLAIILRQVGWRAETVDGGYKAYRGLVVDALYRRDVPAPVVLLAGVTGVAKTALLQRLPAHGHQILDLEGLANHKGSLFGAVGPQPSQKAFESALVRALLALDPSRPVVIEAESSKVGERALPPPLWRAMRAAPAVEVTAPLAARAAFTARTYAAVTADRARLARTIDRLRPYHARDVIEGWQAMAAAGEDEALAGALMAAHYDRRYKRQAERDGQVAATLALGSLTEDALDAAASDLAALVTRVHEGQTREGQTREGQASP